MIAWYSAHSFQLAGLAPRWAILIGVAVFLVVAISVNLLSLAIVRYHRPVTGVREEPTLSDDPTTQPQDVSIERANARLLEIAESDKRNIQNALSVGEPEIHYELLKEVPFVDFTFRVFNGSVYSISLDTQVDGYISFRKQQLLGFMQIVRSFKNLAHGYSGEFTVRQQLSRLEAEFISNAHEPDADYFYLQQLKVKINGGDYCSEVESKRLNLPDLIPMKTVLSESTTQGADTWLHEIAEKDKREIDMVVGAVDCKIFQSEFHSATPYITFQLTIFNGSVYPISIDPKVRGFISYAQRRLVGEMTTLTEWKAKNCLRGDAVQFQICQWLNKEEVEYINQINPDYAYFNFEQLVINIIGGNSVKDITPKPIRFILFKGVDKRKWM